MPEKKEAVKFATIDSTVALMFALFTSYTRSGAVFTESGTQTSSGTTPRANSAGSGSPRIRLAASCDAPAAL